MSFDMTLVQMELNIAKLKQQQQEQQLNKAVNRLNSLKNGGKIEESDEELPDDTGSDTDTESGMDNEVASSGTSMNGRYLAAAINPVLATALETVEAEAEETGAEAGTQNQETEEKTDGSTEENQNASENSTENKTEDNSDVSVDFTDSGTEDTDSLIVEEEPSDDDQNNNFESGDDDNNQQDEDDTGDEENEQNKELTDGNPMFYQVLERETEPYAGTGTKDDPFVFLCSSAKGYVTAKGSFLNKMAGYEPDGTKEEGVDGYWYLLEFHENDTISNMIDRKESCSGYYLVDGSLLEDVVPDTSEVEFSLDGASHYETETPPDDGGGGDAGGDDSSSVSREDAIKTQQKRIASLKLDIRESKLNISKLEKKVKKEVIYSKLDGTVAKVGDPATAASDGNTFMTIKSKEGFYVKGTVSELMLDQVKEGTILNCSGQSGDFEAEVVDVSEYPVSGDSYWGNGNPNVSYYTYIATIPDKTVKVSDEDWLTISLTNSTETKGIVLDKAFVRSENGVRYVYKDDNGVLKKQVLKVGGNVNGGYSVLITGGITRDDKVAFPYGDTVKEGAKTQEVSSSEFYGY